MEQLPDRNFMFRSFKKFSSNFHHYNLLRHKGWIEIFMLGSQAVFGNIWVYLLDLCIKKYTVYFHFSKFPFDYKIHCF